MDFDKQKLEELIKQKKTIGNYIFDEQKQCFLGDAETELCISKVAEDKYKSVCYYFDGYEIFLEDKDVEYYDGNEETAKQKAIESFNRQPEMFMGYPILYTNVTCELIEYEK
ncbi:hypothetical protein ACTHGU_05810 [Chitinophagaceae bacterium MMS25-I14]